MKSRIAINYGLVTRGSGSCSLAVPGQSEQWHDLRPLDSECEQWRWYKSEGLVKNESLENDLIFVLHFAPQDGACNSSVGHHRNLIEAEPCDREHRGLRQGP